MRAMQMGVADCKLKPSGSGNIQSSGDFHTFLLRMIQQIGKTILTSASVTNNYKVQNRPIISPKIIAIGSSTGGPNVATLCRGARMLFHCTGHE